MFQMLSIFASTQRPSRPRATLSLIATLFVSRKRRCQAILGSFTSVIVLHATYVTTDGGQLQNGENT